MTDTSIPTPRAPRRGLPSFLNEAADADLVVAVLRDRADADTQDAHANGAPRWVLANARKLHALADQIAPYGSQDEPAAIPAPEHVARPEYAS